MDTLIKNGVPVLLCLRHMEIRNSR